MDSYEQEIFRLIFNRREKDDTLVLDVGCGRRRAESGAVGLDYCAESGADVVWDVNKVPWPFPSDTFCRVHMSHIIEHVDDVIEAMREVHRVARNAADIFITTPHFSSHNSYTDPTHKHHLAAATFEYFTNREFQTFVGPRCGFEIVSVELTFGGNIVLDNLGRFLARRSLKWYERHVAWILPALDIRARLRCVKST